MNLVLKVRLKAPEKRGNAHIRAVLHMPSMTCVRCNPTLKQFYERLKPTKEKPIVALIAVQRKRLILMYTLWKNQTQYDPEYEIKKSSKGTWPLLRRIMIQLPVPFPRIFYSKILGF